MRFPLLCLFLAIATPVAGDGVRAQDQINRVKTAPQDFRDRQIRLEGEVVELRGISPRSGQGVYRVVDASDRVGVLVRTNHLPNNGGPFRIRARLSPELLFDGVLLLDELDRSAARLPLLPVAGTVGALGLLAAVVALTMLVKTRRTQRHMRLAPPMWLIPTGADPRQEAPTGTEHRFNYHLQYIEEERSEKLDRRQRGLIAALAVASSLGIAGTGWFALLSREDAARPSFVLIPPEMAGLATDLRPERDTVLPHRSDDTLRLGLEPPREESVAAAPPPPPPPPQPPPPAARPRPRQEVLAEAKRRERSTRGDTVRRVAVQPPPPSPARDTVVAAPPPPTVVVLPPPLPAPPPPPPPSPAVDLNRPDTTTRAAAPPPSPEALRAGASVELRAGIDRFVEAIRTRQPGVVDLMYVPEQGEDASRKTKFVSFIRETGPGASLAGTEPVAVTETSGGTRFTLQFRWRGDFGVDRRKAVRFWAAARREGSRWVFSGIRLLESFP